MILQAMRIKYFLLFILLPIAPSVQGQIPYANSPTSHDTEKQVIVRYVINEDGSIGDISVTKGLSPHLDSEAVKVVLSMPKQKPPTQDGKYVKMYFTQPISFKK